MSDKQPRKPLTAAHKAKISAAVKARYSDPDIRAAIGERASKSMTAYHARARAAIEALERDGDGTDRG